MLIRASRLFGFVLPMLLPLAFTCRLGADGILSQIVACNRETASAGCKNPRKGPQGGGLTGSAGSDQERELSRLQCQADVIERKAGAVGSSHPGELEDGAQYGGHNGEFPRSLSLSWLAGRFASP